MKEDKETRYTMKLTREEAHGILYNRRSKQDSKWWYGYGHMALMATGFFGAMWLLERAGGWLAFALFIVIMIPTGGHFFRWALKIKRWVGEELKQWDESKL